MLRVTPGAASHRGRSAVVAVLVAVFVLAACGGGDGGGDVAGVGDRLPAATLTNLRDEGTTDTDAWLGEPLVVNFWAAWCGPCRDEMPHLQDLAQRRDEVRVVGIDLEDDPVRAVRLADEVGVTYDLVEDPDRSYFHAVGGRGAPYTLFVTPDGTIVHRQFGEVTADRLDALVAEHLG